MPVSETILIADDDTDTRIVVAALIEAMGFTPVEAKDGKEAKDLYASERPVLAIVDIHMPYLNGIEVCKHIKSLSEDTLVPVILLTAHTDLTDKVQALDGGADEYVTKPFYPPELRARVSSLLRLRDLSLRLSERNRELREMQARLVQQERQSVVNQLAGTVAHQLGQPLSAIMLNCHLLEMLPKEDERFGKALHAVKGDLKRLQGLIEDLRRVDPSNVEGYFGASGIFDMKRADK